MIGTPDSARMSLQMSMPLRPGSIRSSSTTSGCVSLKMSRARSPWSQNSVSKPSARRTMPIISATAGSSSTTKIRAVIWILCPARHGPRSSRPMGTGTMGRDREDGRERRHRGHDLGRPSAGLAPSVGPLPRRPLPGVSAPCAAPAARRGHGSSHVAGPHLPLVAAGHHAALRPRAVLPSPFAARPYKAMPSSAALRCGPRCALARRCCCSRPRCGSCSPTRLALTPVATRVTCRAIQTLDRRRGDRGRPCLLARRERHRRPGVARGVGERDGVGEASLTPCGVASAMLLLVAHPRSCIVGLAIAPGVAVIRCRLASRTQRRRLRCRLFLAVLGLGSSLRLPVYIMAAIARCVIVLERKGAVASIRRTDRRSSRAASGGPCSSSSSRAHHPDHHGDHPAGAVSLAAHRLVIGSAGSARAPHRGRAVTVFAAADHLRVQLRVHGQRLRARVHRRAHSPRGL